MSRTYRRKVVYGKTDLCWEMRDHDAYSISNPDPPPIDPKSKEGKRRIARWHSDGGTVRSKEPGPSWYRYMFVERPQRREAQYQLRRVLLGEEFEVMLNAKEPLMYWT